MSNVTDQNIYKVRTFHGVNSQNYYFLNISTACKTEIYLFFVCQVTGSWSGTYDFNTYDQNGIIGAHPYHSNFYMAAGFNSQGKF